MNSQFTSVYPLWWILMADMIILSEFHFTSMPEPWWICWITFWWSRWVKITITSHGIGREHPSCFLFGFTSSFSGFSSHNASKSPLPLIDSNQQDYYQPIHSIHGWFSNFIKFPKNPLLDNFSHVPWIHRFSDFNFSHFPWIDLAFLSIDFRRRRWLFPCTSLACSISRSCRWWNPRCGGAFHVRCDDVFESPARWYDGEVYGSMILIYIYIMINKS